MIPRNPLDVLAQHLVSMVADDEWEVDEIERVVTAAEPFSRALAASSSRTCSTCSTAATRPSASPSCARGWSGTAPPGTVRGRKGARQLAVTNAGHDPRPRPLRRPPARRPPGRRARRGDGLRGAPGPDLPARRDHLADRGDHPRPGDRHPGARGARARCRSGAATASAARAELGRAIGEFAREAVAPDARAAGRATTTSTGAPPRTWSPTCASSRPRPGSCPPTRRSWSSASATRSATGACACSRRSAGASTPPGGWRCRRGSATSTTSRPTRSGPTTGSSSTSPTPTRRPTADLVLLEPDEVEDLVVRELGGSALFGARFRENAARSAADPARLSGQAHAAVAAAAEVAEPARGGEGLPPLPGDPRDLPRVPARRARPAGAGRAAARPALAPDLAGRGRDADRLAVRLLAALRLRRHLHVRGRHAQRRAPRRGARARPRPAARAARRRRSCAS